MVPLLNHRCCAPRRFLQPSRSTVTDSDFEIVERVVDGDTLVLASGERVRLIGVDTPETQHPKKPVERFGKDASEFTRHMVEGKRVRLELEPCQRGNRSPRQYAPAAKLGICFFGRSYFAKR